MIGEAVIGKTVESPLGTLRLVVDEGAVVGVYFEGHRPAPRSVGVDGDAPLLRALERQLREWFAGERRAFDLPLSRSGTAFQESVWAELDGIAFGEQRSYGAIAAAIGRPNAARAVGAAVGRNPLSILVPCHRVVGASKALTGFAGGVARKRWLLEHEAGLLSLEAM